MFESLGRDGDIIKMRVVKYYCSLCGTCIFHSCQIACQNYAPIYGFIYKALDYGIVKLYRLVVFEGTMDFLIREVDLVEVLRSPSVYVRVLYGETANM
ncbi:hypothetical protein Zmor_011476 [Zophobas morio]|uniref:Uncharacterized protein n=1 Tax=Zophobas morio TaxID=2755281 RepID=A0AA38IQZ9_9CUCU|nr:hypothetical protein Zmor_011476 [Zophobas morio]